MMGALRGAKGMVLPLIVCDTLKRQRTKKCRGQVCKISTKEKGPGKKRYGEMKLGKERYGKKVPLGWSDGLFLSTTWTGEQVDVPLEKDITSYYLTKKLWQTATIENAQNRMRMHDPAGTSPGVSLLICSVRYFEFYDTP